MTGLPFTSHPARLRRLARGLAALAAMLISCETSAQETTTDWAWTPITTVDSVDVLYIFYREADTQNNGVVLKLVNRNARPVRYRFLAVFKSGRDEVEKFVRGRVEARTAVTGDEPGLFFIPFTDGRSIGEIGLRGIRITKLRSRTGGAARR